MSNGEDPRGGLPPAIPDLQLCRLLAKGGFGEVWLALAPVTGIYRAVKLLRKGKECDIELEGVRNRLRYLGEHANFVSVLHVGEVGDCIYYEMELADGYPTEQAADFVASYEPRTLKGDLLRRGPLALEEACELVRQISSALGYIHKKGLLHRDVKPDNVVFVRGVPKLTDISLMSRRGQPAVYGGTPAYMPPETVVDASGDIYCLARVLYELVTCSSPRSFPEIPELVSVQGTTRVDGAPPSPPSRLLPNQESIRRLLPVLDQACDPDPQARFQSCEAFELALDRALGIEEGRVGSSIGSYRLIRSLGEGNMGEVFLAEERGQVRRQVALKLIKLGMDTKELLARFEVERQAMALMSSPHIATVFAASATSRGRPYFVMEYIPGDRLCDFADRGQLDIPSRLRLFLGVCDGVQHAHQKGVLHRDLKPSNVLAMESPAGPIAKIIDFGVAKALFQPLTDKSLHTQHAAVGTPGFMSPEQADPSGRDIDTRTDVYSLGAILYQLLTGEAPLDPQLAQSPTPAGSSTPPVAADPARPSTRIAKLDGSKADSVARQRGLVPAQLERKLRGDLDWIVLKALAHERERRYASASELAADIERHLRFEPVLAGPPSLTYRTGKFLRRNRGRVIAGLLVLLSVAAALGINAFLASKERRQAAAAIDDAIAAGQLAEARNRLEGLRIHWPQEAEVARLSKVLQGAESAAQLEKARGYLQRGKQQTAEILKLSKEPEALRKEWDAVRKSHASWEPVWQRADELQAWQRRKKSLAELETKLGQEYLNALLSFSNGIVLAPVGSGFETEATAAVDSFLRELYSNIGSARLLGALQVAPPSATAPDVVMSRLQIASEPPGAEVYCFVYRSFEARLVPVPYDPRAQKAGNPALRVRNDLTRPAPEPFQPGDQLVAIEGTHVGLPSELARVLATVKAKTEVLVEVVRAGNPTKLRWIPFKSEEAVKPVSSFEADLGLRLEGYPLEASAACRVGIADPPGLEVVLPPGSYLLLLRGGGLVDARVPVQVPDAERALTVRMYRAAEVPPGFAYVPGGQTSIGGDTEAYSPLPGRQDHVPGFFMGVREVAFREYLEFLNDPDIDSQLDKDGRIPAKANWGDASLQPFRPKDGRVSLLPQKGKDLYVERAANAKSWLSRLRLVNQDLGAPVPVLSVSMAAGVEYAHWLTRKAQAAGRPWRFRLPHGNEWEKAARGCDGRAFVWGGDYFVWSFCASSRATSSGSSFGASGSYPFDESPYGIQDLAGSLAEPTLDEDPHLPGEYTLRGGSWQTTDERDFRAATRDQRFPHNAHPDLGIRLVCEILDAEPKKE